MKRIVLLLLLLCSNAWAVTFTDLKFGRYQIADSQWNVSACTQTATCQIYSKNPGTAYKIPWTSGQLTWAAGDYVSFVATGNATNPYNGIQYNANGTQKAVMGTGHIINMGPDYFFFVGNDNNTGQLFSMTSGFSNTSGVTWTGTRNPTQAQVDAYASSGSTTPLAAGQTVAPPAPPPGPTVTGGTITQTNSPGNEPITSGGSSTAGYTGTQQTRVTTWTNTTQSANNYLYIEQISGDLNKVNVTQSGTKNTINLGLAGTGNNNVTLNQIGSAYLNSLVQGSSNAFTSTQSNTTGANYQETKIIGNNNAVITSQTGNASQLMFNTINGNNNTVTATQTGTAQHYLETKLTGNGNSVLSDQSGNISNKANIDLTNGGGPATLDLQQTGGKFFTIIQTCTNPAGCNTTVRQ